MAINNTETLYTDSGKNIYISADEIKLGEDFSFGKNIDIRVKGKFHLGDRSRLGNEVNIRANNVIIGDDLYHSQGLRVGGGGRFHPTANLTIGDRCTIHNNFINVAEPVILGNDVGLSQDVSIITHGYWLSVLKGFPAKFAGVEIGDGVIIGYRSMILMGVNIGHEAVVGAGSVVTKNLEPRKIYGGNPAKEIGIISPMALKWQKPLVSSILEEYKKIAEYHGIEPDIEYDFPTIRVNKAFFNVQTLKSMGGEEDEETDDFRDYVRKWGLRFYTKRPFKSKLEL